MSLLKKIANAVIGEETEEEKNNRLEKEKLIKNQINIIENMKCPICGNTEFNKSYVSNGGPYGGSINRITTYHKGYNQEYKEKIMVCTTCGNVQIFADFKTKQIRALNSI